MLQDHEKEKLRECISLCWQCRAECQMTLFNHCLERGGPHMAEDHVKRMTDCIQICQVAADFMTRHSAMHGDICAACASVCDACAESCGDIGGAAMQHCADTCRRCAEHCREMGNMFYAGRKVDTGMATRI